MEKTRLGSYIFRRRQNLGISQRELAKAVNISNSTISRLESENDAVPDTGTLRKISSVLRYDKNPYASLVPTESPGVNTAFGAIRYTAGHHAPLSLFTDATRVTRDCLFSQYGLRFSYFR